MFHRSPFSIQRSALQKETARGETCLGRLGVHRDFGPGRCREEGRGADASQRVYPISPLDTENPCTICGFPYTPCSGAGQSGRVRREQDRDHEHPIVLPQLVHL